MTVINPNSISGITSITLPAGGDNVLTIHTNDGVERFRIDSSGNIKVGSAATISPDGDVFFTGVTTATTFTGAHSGSGANLTSLPSAQLSGALPAISAASLTNVPAANVVGVHTSLTVTNATTTGTAVVGGGVTISESGIEASGIGITCANLNGGQFGRRNKVINGAMQVAQRSTSVASITSGDYYVCDRWKLGYGTAGTWTLSQSTTTPNDFGNSIKFDCTSANTSLSAGSNLQLIQYFEGQDLQDIQKGTSAAREITVSFYVKTNKTGTYVVELMDHDNSNRHCSKSYTVSDTNWNRYILTFPADTTGTLDNDNAKSFEIGFWLVAGSTFTSGSLQTSWGALSQSTRAVGQVNLADSTSNEWYLTGVQLEVGSQATAFEHRSKGEETRLCQRYFYPFLRGTNSYENITLGFNYNSTTGIVLLEPPVEMRDTPSLTSSGTIGADDDTSIGFTFEGQSSKRCFRCNITNHSKTSGQGFQLRAHNSTSSKFELSAEL